MVSDGVLSFVVLLEHYQDMIDQLRAECADESHPEDIDEICKYVNITGNPQPLFGFHANEDGTYDEKDAEHPGNAAAACMKFTATETTVAGYQESELMD